MRARTFFRLILVVIPTAGLMLLWLLVLPRQGQAAPASAPTPASGAAVRADPEAGSERISRSRSSSPVRPTPDPRWLDIVRAQGTQEKAPDDYVPAAQALTINLNLTDSFVAGRAPSAASMELTITDLGQVIANTSVQPVFDGNGFFYMSSIYDVSLQPGYGLWVSQGAATISMTVPTLTGLAFPQTDILSGTAPVDAALTAFLFPYANPEQTYTATATASSGGTYQMDWALGVDLRPQDSGYLLNAQDAARQTYIRFVAPYLLVQVGGPVLYGAAAPNQSIDLVVKDSTGAVLERMTAYTGRDGYFSGDTCGLQGSIDFQPSYQVIGLAGGQTFSTTVVDITAQADWQAGQVTGLAPASQPVEVWLFSGPLHSSETCIRQDTPIDKRTVTAAVDGGYAAPLPLQAGSYGIALANTPEGSQVYAQFLVPYLNARLGGPFEIEGSWERLWGQVDAPNKPVTVEVQGPSGYLKDWYTLYTSENGFVDDVVYGNGNMFLESGDRITLTIPQGPQLSMLLPALTAEADSATDIVSGHAPPFSQVVVTVYAGMQLTVTASADAGGNYSADFSGLGGWGNGYPMLGFVTWTSPVGYTATRFFEVPYGNASACPPRLEAVQVGGNSVYLTDAGQCGRLTFRLRGADGQIKFEHEYPYNPGFVGLYDKNAHPLLMLPGDQIEIEADGQIVTTQTPTALFQPNSEEGQPFDPGAPQDLMTYLVPTLTLTLDPQADLAYGQAPPLAVVYLSPLWEGAALTTTASAQGAYTFDLAGMTNLEAGSSLQVWLRGNPSFYANGVVPVLDTVMYSKEVNGSLKPFTPYTITLASPITVSAPITGYANAWGYFPSGPYPPPNGYHGSPGDSVRMETPGRLWEMIIPVLTAHVDATAGVVSGEAPPASHLEINLNINDEPAIKSVITATAQGTYAVSFPVPPGPLHIIGNVIHFTTFDMLTYLNFNTPSWSVYLGSGWVYGTAQVYGGPITVTLQSYDNLFTQAVTGTLHQNQFGVVFDRSIHPGDRLTLETLSGVVNEFTVPYISAVYDFTRRVLEGRAPPGGELSATIPTEYISVERHVRLLPDGSYGLDLSDLNLHVGSSGNVYYTDRLGNNVTYPFTNRGYPLYLPVLRWAVPFP